MQDYKSYLTERIPVALQKLKFEKVPLWGKMTAQHMVEHMTQAITSSTILSLTPPRSLNAIQIQARQLLLESDADFPRGLQNPMFQFGLPPYEHADIEIAKNKLIEKINLFYKVFEAKPTATTFNLFLGDITFEECQKAHAKHFKHHFTQFELL